MTCPLNLCFTAKLESLSSSRFSTKSVMQQNFRSCFLWARNIFFLPAIFERKEFFFFHSCNTNLLLWVFFLGMNVAAENGSCTLAYWSTSMTFVAEQLNGFFLGGGGAAWQKGSLLVSHPAAQVRFSMFPKIYFDVAEIY